MKQNSDKQPHEFEPRVDFSWGIRWGLSVAAGFLTVSCIRIYFSTPTGTLQAIFPDLLRSNLLAGVLGGTILGSGRRFMTSQGRAQLIGAIVGCVSMVQLGHLGLQNPQSPWYWIAGGAGGALIGAILANRYWNEAHPWPPRRK